MWRCIRWLVLSAMLVSLHGVSAEDAFYAVPLGELELQEGTLPTQEEGTWRDRQLWRLKPPYVILDGDGEAYVNHDAVSHQVSPGERLEGSERWALRTIVLRTAAPREVTGRLYVPTSDGRQMVQVRFKVPASRANRDAREPFYQQKKAHFDWLLGQGLPGAAWFRHEMRQAQRALGEQPGDVAADESPAWASRGARAGELADTYALFTGGRAMSENLQLDRVLNADRQGQQTVELSSLEGITIREIDWKPLIKDFQPELDPLAARIPADQHAVFFPSFDAAVAVFDELTAHSALVLELAEPQSTSARTFERYQRQLCLPVTGLARLLGPAVVRSVAITGSDPYFRTGTDVAVLFEAVDPAALDALLAAQAGLLAGQDAAAQAVQGEVDGLAYQGLVTPDRSICSYRARRDNLVIVTNSLYQLRQLARVSAEQVQSLVALDEYVFFRQRYPRQDAGETAWLFLSDATIRRWCGPQWRIGVSRRTRDVAVVAEIQASQLDRLVAGQVQPGPLYTDLPLGDQAELTLTSQGVHCSTAGSLAFMTPIAELNMDRVTPAEADAYRAWRDRYQQNWRWAFDPIALRMGVGPRQVSADLTIMPLIWGTEYRQLISVSQGTALAADAGDPHDALVHAVLALNPQSETLRRQANFVQIMTGGAQLDSLGWLGSSVAAYLDDDPFWEVLAQVEPDQREAFLKRRGWCMPLAVRAEVSSGVKLTAFLAAVRGFLEQAAPGMLHWESLTYHEQPYVRVTPTPRAAGQSDEMQNSAIYYSASGQSLVVSLSEDVLKRAIDREAERGQRAAAGQEPPQPARAWLGSNLALQVDQKALQVLSNLGRQEYQTRMQTLAWGNLPILNAWKHRYPDQDPVDLHERYWHTALVCPGGGQYVWNEQWQTMESTVYGCPAAPRSGPIAAAALSAVKRGSFGVTFEEQGLRARVVLDR